MRVLFLLLRFLCDILLFAVDRNCCCVMLLFADAVCFYFSLRVAPRTFRHGSQNVSVPVIGNAQVSLNGDLGRQTSKHGSRIALRFRQVREPEQVNVINKVAKRISPNGPQQKFVAGMGEKQGACLECKHVCEN